MGVLLKQTKNAIKSAFERHTALNKCTNEELQVIIGIEKNGEQYVPVYSVTKNYDYNNRKVFDFENLTGIGLDGKWDLLNKKELSAVHLPQYMNRVSKEKSIDAEATEIMVTRPPKSEDFVLWLYNKKQPIKPIDFDYLFGDEEDRYKNFDGKWILVTQ